MSKSPQSAIPLPSKFKGAKLIKSRQVVKYTWKQVEEWEVTEIMRDFKGAKRVKYIEKQLTIEL